MNERTVSGLLKARTKSRPDEPFLWCDGAWISYAETLKLSERFAAGLHSHGASPGDRVAMVLPNVQAGVVCVFACALLGAIQVSLNTFLRGEFLRYQLGDSRASIVVTDAMGFEQIKRVAAELPELRTVILVDGIESVDLAGLDAIKVVSYRSVLDSGHVASLPEVAPETIFSILYTSGTTGMPKGCLVSHRYAVSVAGALCDAGRFVRGDRVLTASPLFHSSGQIFAMMSALYAEGSIAFARDFQASTFMALAGELDVTVVFGVGAVGAFILAQPERVTDRTHKVRQGVFNGLPEATQLAIEQRFGIHVVGEMYGHSEFVPIAISPVDGPRRRDSGGIVRADIEVQIVDHNDLPVPIGSVGEIVARPREPGIMFEGYWDNPQATIDTWRNLWHHTGDLGRFDADGFLFFVDRKKEAIRRRGEFVTARELELAIVKHPDVEAVAVHAVDSEITEDEIKAWLVFKPGVAVTPEALFKFFRAELPYFAIPRFVEVVDALPTNHSARVMKHELKARSHGNKIWDFNRMGLTVPRDERRS